jgi:hypothetical protein
MHESGDLAPPLLISARNGVEWSVSRQPCRCTPGVRAHCTLWSGGWLGLTVGDHVMQKGKSCPAVNRTPALQPVILRYTD